MKKAIKLLSTSLLLSVTFSHISHGMNADGDKDNGIPKPLSASEALEVTRSKVQPPTPTKKAPRPEASKPTEEGTVIPKEGSTSAPTTPAKVGTPKRPTSSPSSSRTSSPAKGTPRKDLNHKLYPDTGFAYAIHRYEWVPEWLHDTNKSIPGKKSAQYAAWRLKVLEHFLENKRPSVADKPINEIAGAYVHLQLQATRDVELWSNGMDTGTLGRSDVAKPKLPYIFQYAAQHNHFGVAMAISEKLTSEMLRNESSRWADRFQTALGAAAFFNNVEALTVLTETRLNVAGFDSLYNALASAIHQRDAYLPSFDAIEYILLRQISTIEINNQDGLRTAQRNLSQLAAMYAKKNAVIQANGKLDRGIHDRANEIAGIIAAVQASTENKLAS